MTDVAAITAAVSAWRYTYLDEHYLQAGLAAALNAAAIAYQREVVLGPRDRIDFLAGTVGIEVKVAGSPARVAAQLLRYAHSDRVDALVLITTRRKHRALPPTLADVPLTDDCLGGI